MIPPFGKVSYFVRRPGHFLADETVNGTLTREDSLTPPAAGKHTLFRN